MPNTPLSIIVSLSLILNYNIPEILYRELLTETHREICRSKTGMLCPLNFWYYKSQRVFAILEPGFYSCFLFRKYSMEIQTAGNFSGLCRTWDGSPNSNLRFHRQAWAAILLYLACLDYTSINWR